MPLTQVRSEGCAQLKLFLLWVLGRRLSGCLAGAASAGSTQVKVRLFGALIFFGAFDFDGDGF